MVIPSLKTAAQVMCLAGALFMLLPQGHCLASTPLRESGVCMDCHDAHAPGLAYGPHRVSEDGPACTDCHAGDSRHYEDDPEQFAMINPAELEVAELGILCSSCHFSSHQQNMAEGNVHSDQGIGCLSCHKVHDNGRVGLLREAQTPLCASCHSDVEGQFALSFRHPVAEGVMECSDCHQSLDLTRSELSWNGTNVCTDCHGEFAGPFPFEHQASVDYSTEEGSCLTCHAAHGSHLARMLKQPYDSPHFQLCSQCHSVPGHQWNSFHATQWAGIACNDCHTDVHGSYSSRYLLSESLEGQGCFNSGCHQF